MGKRMKNRCYSRIGGLLCAEAEDIEDIDEMVTTYCVKEKRYADQKRRNFSNFMKSDYFKDHVTSSSVASHGEWYVIIDLPSKGECFLWSCVSHQKIKLPKLSIELDSYFKCILTAPPTEEHCEVLFFDKNSPYLLSGRVGYGRWTELMYGTTREHVFSEAIYFNKKIYAIRNGRRLLHEVVTRPAGTFSKKVRAWRQEEEEVGGDMFLCPQKQHLVDSCGNLFLVQRFSDDKLRVYKRYFSFDKWRRVWSLGNCVFFLSCNHSVSLNAEEMGVEGNCIYFVKDDSRSLYIFNLRDETLSVSQHYCLEYGDFRPSWKGRMPVLRLAHNPTSTDLKEPEEKEAVDVDAESHTGFQLLPPDMVMSIARCLTVWRDYMNVRLVCKGWSLAAPPCSWRYDSKSPVMPYPWLLFFQAHEKGKCSFHDPGENVRYHKTTGGLSLDSVIRFCKDGWLLLSHGDKSFCLLDQVSHHILKLPGTHIQYLCGMCFSGSPGSSDFVVAAVGRDGSKNADVYFLRPNSKSWSRIAKQGFMPSRSNPVFLNGKFYFLGLDGSLGMLTLLPEATHIWNVLNPLHKLQFPTPVFQSFLVSVIEEPFLSVFVGNNGEWVHVYRYSMPEGKWELLDSLSDRTLFVSETASLVLKAEENAASMRNKIYFPQFSKSNGYILFYSMESSRFGSNEEDGHLNGTFDGASEKLNCTWFRHRLIPSV